MILKRKKDKTVVSQDRLFLLCVSLYLQLLNFKTITFTRILCFSISF